MNFAPTSRPHVPPTVLLRQVDKVFGNGTAALQGVDLSVGTGEFLSLVGPSGCGKSTILSLVAGLTTPTRGELLWSDPALRQELAFVFQDAALLPWGTVRDNVRLPLKLMGRDRGAEADRAVAEAIALVGLEGFETAFPRELSGGMRMRVSIARAVVAQPKVVLMDEPFGALDEITRNQLNEEVMQLWLKKSWTALFVTHNIYEAVYLSSRVVVMGAKPGRIVADVSIDAPFPRTEQFRRSPEFAAYRDRLTDALADGMAGRL
ncbi:MAG: ABC transporter ATP-binding protein [Cyanobacteria bacterium]|nr:ABC transporter ATP-binding protein [Cyanobacteriota bacterium]